MTGTALTEETEFREIYGMDVVVIPTNRPVIRKDLQDAVYKTKREKPVSYTHLDVYKRQGYVGRNNMNFSVVSVILQTVEIFIKLFIS